MSKKLVLSLKNKNMRFSIIFFAILGLCFFACQSTDKKEEKSQKMQLFSAVVKTYSVTEQSENNQIKVLGIITSESEVKPSFKTGGVIRQTYVKEGDIIKKGQLLATLEMDEIDAQVRQAEEGLKKSERDLVRVKNLYKDSVATLEQVQNATTVFELTKRNTQIAKFNRSYSVIRSSIDGKVIKQIMFKGEITGPGNPIYAILGIGSKDWVIKAGLTDRDWARVTQEDTVTITMDAYPDRSFVGYIANKSSVGGNASGTFDVEIRFKENTPILAVGLIANVNISMTKSVTHKIIPIEALVKTDGNTAYAYTIKNGLAKRIKLTIAKLLGDKVAISNGLEGIEMVVTTGAMYLEEGDKVTY